MQHKHISKLDPGDRNILRSKSVVYFQERFPRYDKLNFTLIGNTLVIQISNLQDLPVLIKACPELLVRASTSIGVPKIAIRLLKAIVFEYSFGSCPRTLEFNQQASIIKKGLEQMSQAIAIPTPTQDQEKTILRAEIENDTDTSSPSFTDELISLTEITARTGIPEAGLTQYINLDGIKAYKLRGEILLPSGAIRLAIEGFYAWEASMKSSEAINLLVQQEIQITNGTKNASNVNIKTEQVKQSEQTKQTNNKRAKYKLAPDFKVSNSYNKTITSIIEAQGKKSAEYLQDITSSSSDGIAIIKKAALKYKNPEKAEKGLIQAAVEIVNSQSQTSQ